MINENRIKEILEKPVLAAGVEKYNRIMARFRQTDISADLEFQALFRDFYQMRRFYSDEFAKRYFRLMEQMKNSQEVNFRMALERVRRIQNTYEMSFSSKLLHTLNPHCFIWDSVVTGRHFGIKVPTCRKNREEACSKRYEEYEEKFLKFLSSEEGQLIIRLFDGKFPDSGISDVKKIDFILWQDR